MAEQLLKKISPIILVACLLLGGAWACVSGGGEGAGGGVGGDGATIGGPGSNFQAAAPSQEGPGSTENAPAMPDVVVGPSADIVVDPNGPHYDYGWRVHGEATAPCTAQENVQVRKIQEENSFFAAWDSKFLDLFIGCAQAKMGSNGESIKINVLNSPPPPPAYVRVFIQGQLQYSVNGGEFANWIPENFEGDHYLRVMDQGNFYVDTKIKAGGKVELYFTLRVFNGLTADHFNFAMNHLHFYRTSSSFVAKFPEQQKECGPQSLCKYNMSDMNEMVSPSPNYGADSDFSNLPVCESTI